MSSTAVFNSQGNVARYARRNMIINGNLYMWQRGTAFSGANGYGPDRWATFSVNNMDQSADLPVGSVAPWSLQITGQGGGSSYAYTSVELYKPGSPTPFVLNSESYTLSFKGKAPVGSDVTTTVWWVDTVLSGTNRVDILPATILGTGTGNWETYQHTFTIAASPAGTSKALQFQILSVLADTAWFITEVQLERGSTATDFEVRPSGEEWDLAQRYYETSTLDTSLAGTRTDQMSVNIPFAVRKRVTPTITYNGVGIVTPVVQVHPYGWRIIDTGGGLDGQNNYVDDWIADAEL